MKKFIVIALLLFLPFLCFGQDGGINRGLISGPNFIPSLVGTTTWGSGSAFTWTFDAGATDPTFTFGNGTIVLGGGVFTFPNVGLSIYDTNASHYLILAPGSNLTGNKTLTLTTGDSDRTITLSGNPTLADWFDQAVKAASSVTFGNVTDSGLTITRIPFASTAGLLVDDADMAFVTDTLTVTKTLYYSTIISDGATGNVTSAQMMGQTHKVTGAYTLSLPTSAAGYRCTFEASTANIFSIDVQTGTDIIILNGTALTAGNKITTDGTLGAKVYIESTESGYYRATSILGVISDGGA